MAKLTDDSPFPFGKYKGTPIGKVPSEYLDWFIGQKWAEKQYPEVAEYVNDPKNRAAIDQDLFKEGKI